MVEDDLDVKELLESIPVLDSNENFDSDEFNHIENNFNSTNASKLYEESSILSPDNKYEKY
jgi:hypothetical protein